MRIVDLARELELPPSEVLQACQRLGIEAAWAGADISASDVVVLRADLAAADAPLDLTEPSSGSEEAATASGEASTADGDTAPEPDATAEDAPPADPPSAASAPPAPAPDAPTPAPRGGPLQPAGIPGATVPPTAASSIPHLIDEITPEPEPEVAASAPTAGPLQTGATIVQDRETISQAAPVRRSARSSSRSRKDQRFDRGVRASIVFTVLAVAAVVGTNHFDNPWPPAIGWFAGFVFLIVAIVKGSRAWYRASTHPDKIAGQWLAMTASIVAVLLLLCLGMGSYVIVRSGKAADAPFGIGDLNSVNQLRWGYQRVQLVRRTGWEAPAKDAGTCWADRANASNDKVEQRRSERTEYGQTRVGCGEFHISEVLAVYSVNEDADAPYPGTKALTSMFLKDCLVTLDGIRDRAAKKGNSVGAVELKMEYPSKKGWERSDHDVACVAITPKMNHKLGAATKDS